MQQNGSRIRVLKDGNFTVMKNYHLRDKTLSLKAKGLLSVVLSLPSNWDYSIAGLVAILKENETAVNSALKELKSHGFLKVVKHMPSDTKSGRIEYEYLFTEEPFKFQDSEKQGVEKQGVDFLGLEFLGLENQGQLNKDKLNTEELNKEELNKEETKSEISNVLPDEALELADHLRDKILEYQPTACIKGNYRVNWARDIEKAHRLDGRRWEALRGMIDYCYDVSNFWCMNIRSGAKLRKHYDQIEAQIMRDAYKNGTMIAGGGNDNDTLKVPF